MSFHVNMGNQPAAGLKFRWMLRGYDVRFQVWAPDLGLYPLLFSFCSLKRMGPYWYMVYSGYMRLGAHT